MKTSSKNFAYGLHSVHALLDKAPKQVIKLFLQETRNDPRVQEITTLASKHHIPIHFVTRQTLEELIGNNSHQGVVAQIQQTKPLGEFDLNQILSTLSEPPFLLILDNIQDPHNLGACLRSADATGIHAVIIPKDCSAGLTQTVRKVASGAAENVPVIQVTNLVRTIKELKKQNIWIIGATGEADQSVFEADLTGPIALVLGNETKGLRRLTKEHCDRLLNIPMMGSVSSLNVSVATGIFLFEAIRQRQTM